MTQQFYLVRLVIGRRKATVTPMRGKQRPRWWKYPRGVSVIGQSVTDALQLANLLLGRVDDDE